MPDTPAPDVVRRTAGEAATARSSSAVLLAALAQAVLAVPGVVQLEPTLSTSGPAVLLRHSPTDGIRIMMRADVAEIDVSLATTAACQARAVAHQVRSVVADLLTAHGYTNGSVAVSVLTIHPAGPPVAPCSGSAVATGA
jgi:uncharacterized alkaline shock family protein YloU